MDKILEINNLKFSYEEKNVLENIVFSLSQGDILCIKGKNGAGKTTLLKVLSGILDTDGYDAKYKGEPAKLDEIKKYMMYVPSSPYLYVSLTGWQNIELIRNLWNVDKDIFYSKINKYIHRYEMSDYLDDFVESYSLGMKYKVYFVAMLSVDSNIILMDEPLNAMDYQSQSKAVIDLKEIVSNGKKAILFSSHISSLIYDLSNRELILHNGKFVQRNL